jgi:hypothetical protein
MRHHCTDALRPRHPISEQQKRRAATTSLGGLLEQHATDVTAVALSSHSEAIP